MKKKNNEVYIMYEYNTFKKDFEYIYEYYNLKDLQKHNNIQLENKKSIYHYIYNTIEEAFTINNKINNKYIIIKEDI